MLTLGINYSQMHDSSACIVRDGALLFAVAEERISRLKHDARFPQLAIQACLDFAKVTAAQVDEVCLGWQPAGEVFRHDLKLYATGQWPVSYMNLLNSTRHFASMWHQESGAAPFRRIFGSGKARFRYVDHHLAHALSCYAYSGFDDAAVVVMDGRGAWEAVAGNVDALNFVYHKQDGTQATVPQDIQYVEIALLVRARNAEPKFINTTTYHNKQGDVLCQSCTGDHYRRRLLTTTVQMRNVRLAG